MERPSRANRFFTWVRGLFGPTAFVFFGVVLPAATLAIELATGMCAEALNIDPIPTLPHILAVASVPVTLGAWGLLRRRDQVASPAWRLALGMVLGVSLIYAIPFTPIVPLAIIATVFGIGFLPLAPLGGAVVAAIALWKMGRETGWRGWWGSAGFVTALVVMTLLALPTIITDHALELTDAADVETQIEGIELLRTVDEELVEQRLCEYRRSSHPNPISPFSNLFADSYQTARPELFWRVTGRSCEHGWWSPGTRFFRETERENVLELSASRLDSSVDTVAATAYTEWLYEVRNPTSRQEEADFIVQLPPGAVVSRVTLWVHGEPREATFTERSQAEAAYETIVRRSRDPILVTSVGPDRVRVRMFPVQPNSRMKARIGVSQPLELEADGHSRMQFPHIVDGNVDFPHPHSVWVEAKHPISTPNLTDFVELQEDGVHQVRGSVAQNELGAFEVDMERQPATQVFARDGERWVVQEAGRLKPEPPGEVVVVLDGGAGMAPHLEEISAAFDLLKASQLTVYVAGDQTTEVLKNAPMDHARPALREFLEQFEFVGGRDNMPALRRALDTTGPDVDVVWIHAAQPVSLAGFMATPERASATIYELQVDGERDVNTDALHEAGLLQAIPRRGSVGADLVTWFASRSTPTWRTERTFTDVEPTHGKETSRHLARIAANEKVFELMRAGRVVEATELAGAYQIVTPVSAAIVLETQAQYDEFGIEMASGEGVPSIPEPHEWALIIIGTLALAGAVWRKRQQSGEQGLGLAGAR